MKILIFCCFLFIGVQLNAKNISNKLINADVDSKFFQKCMNKSGQKKYEKCNDLNNKQFPMITAENKIFGGLKKKIEDMDIRLGNKPTNIPLAMISASESIFDPKSKYSKYIIAYYLLNNEHDSKDDYFLYNFNSSSQRINLGSDFQILNKGKIIIKNKQKYFLNSKGLYELKK